LGDTEDKEGIELRDKIRVMIKEINKKLKHIEIQLGTGKQITSHIARHSFAYNARIISGNDIYAVQKALGHGSIATTERYFATDSTIEADDLVRKMFS
jgi:site-specific recombinase XerD